MIRNRPGIAFILASTDHGAMIVNRLDYRVVEPGHAYGVGLQILNNASYQPDERKLATTLLDLRRQHFGTGVNVLDIGANIGAFTIAWAKHMAGWGEVLAVEAQERIFYALAGNIAINNCFNARAIHAAATSQCGKIRVPTPDYSVPGSFGSLELRPSAQNEDIGQPIDYSEAGTTSVSAVSVDSLDMQRLDLMKIDVERMELEVLEGARQTVRAHRPIIVVEKLKTDPASLRDYLDGFGYRYFSSGLNLVAIHPDDPCSAIGQEAPRK